MLKGIIASSFIYAILPIIHKLLLLFLKFLFHFYFSLNFSCFAFRRSISNLETPSTDSINLKRDRILMGSDIVTVSCINFISYFLKFYNFNSCVYLILLY